MYIIAAQTNALRKLYFLQKLCIIIDFLFCTKIGFKAKILKIKYTFKNYIFLEKYFRIKLGSLLYYFFYYKKIQFTVSQLKSSDADKQFYFFSQFFSFQNTFGSFHKKNLNILFLNLIFRFLYFVLKIVKNIYN